MPRTALSVLSAVVLTATVSASTGVAVPPAPTGNTVVELSDSSRGARPRPPTPPAPPADPEPPAGDFPTEDTTGVPDGVTLSPSGTVTITKDGTVVDGLHVTGRILIEADNVTVRNTLVETKTDLYPIHVRSGSTNALIEDVEVDNLGGTGIGVFFQGSGTLRRADIHSAEDGIRIQASNVKIADSYIHHLQRQPGGHHDTIQIRRGDNVTISGNNLQPYNDLTDDPMNSALQIGSLLGEDQISNLLVTGNLLNGGNFTINGGGRQEVDSARYSYNHFGRDFRYAPSGNIQNSVWEDTNVWHDTGEPVD